MGTRNSGRKQAATVIILLAADFLRVPMGI